MLSDQEEDVEDVDDIEAKIIEAKQDNEGRKAQRKVLQRQKKDAKKNHADELKKLEKELKTANKQRDEINTNAVRVQS